MTKTVAEPVGRRVTRAMLSDRMGVAAITCLPGPAILTALVGWYGWTTLLGGAFALVFLFRAFAPQLVAAFGDAEMKYALGVRICNGHGYRPDLAEAARWFREAAQDGHRGGKLALASIQASGPAELRDHPAALAHARELAEQGMPRAQVLLARLLRNGVGAFRNPGEALKWLERAADAFDVDALTELGYLYATGEVVDQDGELARKYWFQAATRGSAIAAENLGELYARAMVGGAAPTTALMWFRVAIAWSGKLDEQTVPYYEQVLASLDDPARMEAERLASEWLKSVDSASSKPR